MKLIFMIIIIIIIYIICIKKEQFFNIFGIQQPVKRNMPLDIRCIPPIKKRNYVLSKIENLRKNYSH